MRTFCKVSCWFVQPSAGTFHKHFSLFCVIIFTADKNGIRKLNKRFAFGGAAGLSERSCWTREGKTGTCMSIRECYPFTRFPDLSDLETWAIGTKGTCHYGEPTGRQVMDLMAHLSRIINFLIMNTHRFMVFAVKEWPIQLLPKKVQLSIPSRKALVVKALNLFHLPLSTAKIALLEELKPVEVTGRSRYWRHVQM